MAARHAVVVLSSLFLARSRGAQGDRRRRNQTECHAARLGVHEWRCCEREGRSHQVESLLLQEVSLKHETSPPVLAECGSRDERRAPIAKTQELPLSFQRQ
jgi:hypothetical protein